MVLKSYNDADELCRLIKAEANRSLTCTVLIMVAAEVDAMASARMLRRLLEADHILFNMQPVSSYTQIMRCYEQNTTEDDECSIFMIDCGGSIDLPNAFGLEAGGNKRVFVLDNHRPIHSLHQVTVFVDAEEIDEALLQLGTVSSVGEEMGVNEEGSRHVLS